MVTLRYTSNTLGYTMGLETISIWYFDWNEMNTTYKNNKYNKHNTQRKVLLRIIVVNVQVTKLERERELRI